MNDMQLMVNNSKLFNGPASPVTSTANKLFMKLKANLDFEKKQHATDQDPISILENAIKKKFYFYYYYLYYHYLLLFCSMHYYS
jgi:hypothetical protein